MGKTALITGAEGALGKVVCKKFSDEGYSVTGTDHKDLNLADSKDIQNKLKGKNFDVVVHCAGGFRFSPIDEMKDEDFQFLIDANLKSTANILRQVIPNMKKNNFGRIVLVGSSGALNPKSGMGPYAATKAGLHALVMAAADEVKKFNININAVLPSVIDTPANRSAMPKADSKSWVSPQDLADIIFSLTQDMGNSIHGALIPVNGRV
jgi:NAD(P)-dependent dehydrogenase (short-subunit alcohol dehydrogenase family)